MSQQINNKLVLKNSIMLYIRMGLVMLVSLYTSRILLQALGIEDYGIYNIVGGVVIMFSFFNNILTVAIRRFLSIAIAKGDRYELDKTFKSSIKAVMLIALAVSFLLETIGLWLVNYKLSIPEGRVFAANCVFQLSVITFILNLNALPYNAAIVSFEKMNIYAYIGIVEVLLKLIFTLCILYISGIDRLILYAVLFCILSNFVRYLDVWYCKSHILRVSKTVKVCKDDVLPLFHYSAWAVLGTFAFMLASQGINIIMNITFGVVLNAAIGISQQVSNAVNQLGGNFQTAFNPQLTKSYAVEGMSNNTYLFTVRVTKITIMLIAFLCFPLLLNINEILNLWLVKVPPYTASICIIAILYVAIDIISTPLYILIYAEGNVKQYSIVLAVIQFVYVFIFYISCKIGASPVQALSLNVICAIALHVGRLIMARKIMKLNIIRYSFDTLKPFVIPFLGVLILYYFIFSQNSESFYHLLFKIFIVELMQAIFFWIFSLDKGEKNYVKTILNNKKYACKRNH